MTPECPQCGRPFVTEVSTKELMIVTCERGHRFTVVAVSRSLAGGSEYDLEDAPKPEQ